MFFCCILGPWAMAIHCRAVKNSLRGTVIIINSVLTLQVSTTSLPHDRKPCEIKVVSNHTCLLHTCVCAGSRRMRLRLSGLINGRNQFNSWGSPQVPHPVRVCTEHLLIPKLVKIEAKRTLLILHIRKIEVMRILFIPQIRKIEAERNLSPATK